MSTRTTERIHVLCVDELPASARIETVLRRDTEQFNVTTASSVRAGADQFGDDVDCVVADCELPDGTAVDLLRLVREQSVDCPFIIFTGTGTEAIASDAISAGVTDYLRRHPDREQHTVLSKRVRAVVDDGQTERDDDGRTERDDAARRADLRRSERQLEAVLDDPKMLVGILSPDGRLRRANEAAMSFVGADHEELIGVPFHETPWWPDDVRDDVRRWVERAAAGEYVEYEADHGHRAGDLRSVSGTIRPVTDEAGAVVSLIASARDITERCVHERELQRRNERLNEVASLVSHDLRSPLNVANGHLSIARDGEADDDHLAEVAHALERMEGLIGDLLTLAHDGERVSELETVGLASAVEECWRTVSTTESAPRVETDLAIRADPNQLRHLLENLLGNALRHGGPDVTITVGRLADRDGFYVADDGVGIPEHEREEIFESGYSTATGGTGVGLSIVERVVDAHDWSVTVTESESGGTRFELAGVECESQVPAPD